MTKELKWVLLLVAVVVAGWGINHYRQQRFVTRSNEAFAVDTAAVYQVKMVRNGQDLVLLKNAGQWSIRNQDSLVVKSDRLNNLFGKVLGVKRETLVSKNPEKWAIYSVDDSLGVHLHLYDVKEQELAHAVFGQSKSDWSHNYIRVEPDPEVYLTNESVIYYLNTQPSYWGEKPKPPEPDTSAVNIQ